MDSGFTTVGYKAAQVPHTRTTTCTTEPCYSCCRISHNTTSTRATVRTKATSFVLFVGINVMRLARSFALQNAKPIQILVISRGRDVYTRMYVRCVSPQLELTAEGVCYRAGLQVMCIQHNFEVQGDDRKQKLRKLELTSARFP